MDTLLQIPTGLFQFMNGNIFAHPGEYTRLTGSSSYIQLNWSQVP